MRMEVVGTESCGMISQEKPLSEGSGRPAAMQPVSGCTPCPQSHATSIQTHQASTGPCNHDPDAPGASGVPGGFSASGRTAALPNTHIFLGDAARFLVLHSDSLWARRPQYQPVAGSCHPLLFLCFPR